MSGPIFVIDVHLLSVVMSWRTSKSDNTAYPIPRLRTGQAIALGHAASGTTHRMALTTRRNLISASQRNSPPISATNRNSRHTTPNPAPRYRIA